MAKYMFDTDEESMDVMLGDPVSVRGEGCKAANI